MATEDKSIFRQSNFTLGDGTRGTVTGSGPPLLLLHGVGLDHHMWQAQVHRFAQSHAVICYDLLGHGESPKISSAAVIGDFVAQLARVVVELGLPSAVVAGFSFGGIIAREFAARYGDKIKKLVLLSTVYERSDAEREAVIGRWEKARSEGPRAIYPAALERWFSPAFLAGQKEFVQQLLRSMMRNDDASFLRAYEIFARSDTETQFSLDAIRCPTLIVTGERDSGSTPAMAWRMASEIANSRVSIIPSGRHMIPLEMAPEVNRELSRFINGE
ncbi:MAG TPA: alpha/beta fold hydrolase [Aestuariivirgaceae bacterium]|jgi:pimeloyl-ACP methyl ester carboxylesterase